MPSHRGERQALFLRRHAGVEGIDAAVPDGVPRWRAHARRLYATVTDRVRVAAALLASRMARGRLASPFTAREVYRNDWTGLTEPRVGGGGARVPPGTRLDSARSGDRPGRWPAHRAVPHQSSSCFSLRAVQVLSVLSVGVRLTEPPESPPAARREAGVTRLSPANLGTGPDTPPGYILNIVDPKPP